MSKIFAFLLENEIRAPAQAFHFLKVIREVPLVISFHCSIENLQRGICIETLNNEVIKK